MNNKNLSISIIVPVYNEVENIISFLSRVKISLEHAKIAYEVIFIDDYSIDGTSQLLQKIKDNETIFVFKKKGKKGKSYSLFEGFSKATSEIIVMIDADLQYPPEAIPEMVKKLAEKDIIVGQRTEHATQISRTIISKTFKSVFGRFLFGIDHDIQSGLKVFKKHVWDTIAFTPASPWTFDLEFLHRSREAGFSIDSHIIVFSKRVEGKSKVNSIRTSFEIGFQAFMLKLQKIRPISVSSSEKSNMKGAGIRYKRKHYVTHSTLMHTYSALETFTTKQRIQFSFLAIALIALLIVAPFKTLQICIAILSFIYFIDVIFNLFLVLKSLHHAQEIETSDEELAAIESIDFPIYTVLCPLYKEGNVVPQFLEAIEKLEYPKNKLDVMLLLEEDDVETIKKVSRMDLPSYVRSVVVPDSIPKTKPKACNYGLAHAKGEFVVIYDAEDMPDPLQLKKALIAFRKSSRDIVCLQAKLNYYNPHQNWLTRFFTAEYSLWFDITLTGLQSLQTNIPLGGTSNHFRTADLQKLQGWDPFNVTEDADLGVRLFKKGFKTAIIDSVTLEEANSNFGNWLRQRSRWIKGYMQTYLVHTRHIRTFIKERGIHSLFFHLTIGGKIAFILINPLLWIATIAYFTLYQYVGPQIEALYPAGVFYMALTSLIVGNFLFMYYYMIGCMKRGQWGLIKFVYFIPFYWLMISISGAMALQQLLFKPHYWEKTVHGLHLAKKQKKEIAKIVVEVEQASLQVSLPSGMKGKLIKMIQKQKAYIPGLILVMANMLANVINFGFNAYLGRVLNLNDFATVSLVGSFLYIATIVSNGFNATVVYRVGFLSGKYGQTAGIHFWKHIRKYSFLFAGIISIIWIFTSSLLGNFFHSSDSVMYILFGIVFFISFAQAIDQGYLSAKLLFIALGSILIFEPLAKLIIAILFVHYGFEHVAYSAIPLSIIASFLLGWGIVLLFNRNKKDLVTSFESKKFPNKFFIATLLTGASSIAFLSFDVILANHYLSSQDAGRYALVSLVGKMIFFLGNLSSPFIMPLVSRNEGAQKNSRLILNATLSGTAVMAGLGFIAFGIFGYITVPVLFGQKAMGILQYLPMFGFTMMCFAISRVFISYYLSKKIYSFPILSFLLALLQIGLITTFHDSIYTFVLVMGIIGYLNVFSFMVLDHFVTFVSSFERNVKDFFGLFSDEIVSEKTFDKVSILIFNWRDTKHKYAGGAEVYIHELAKRWVRDGHKVTVFSGNDGKSSRYDVLDGVEIIRRGGFYFVYVWAFLYYAFRLRNKFDVIIDSENGIPFFTPLYAKQKVFLLIHHVHQEVFRKSLIPPFSWFASFLELKMMPLVYKNTEFITVSPSSKKEILKHKLTKTDPVIIYNGVDLDSFTPGLKYSKPLVVYIGRLQSYKSLHVFIKAAKQVLNKVPHAEFIIAGDGEEKTTLQKLAKKMDINNKITFLGKISEKEKIDLYRKAWVFVNPSFMEGWGITTIEANACGTPAIASNVPGLKDSVQHQQTGMLVPYGNVDAFAKEIITIVTDKNLQMQLSKNAVAWANQFNWETSAQNAIRILNQEKKKKLRIHIFSYAQTI